MRILQLNNKDKLIIKSIRSTRFLSIDNIVYVVADNNYSKIILADQSDILVTMTLKDVEKTLQAYDYIRCHKSYLVNIEYIKELYCKDTFMLKLSNKHKIPVSREGLKRLKKVLKM